MPDPYDVNLPAVPILTEGSAPDIEFPQWDGSSRVNIAFLGSRGDESRKGCLFCTETIILLTVDPVTKTAGMLSIPRDMWVNTAWTMEEA